MKMVKPKCRVQTKHRFSPRHVVQLPIGTGVQCCSLSGSKPPSEENPATIPKCAEGTMSEARGHSVSTQCETASTVWVRREGEDTREAPVVSPDDLEDSSAPRNFETLHVRLNLVQKKRFVFSTMIDNECTEHRESSRNISCSLLEPSKPGQAKGFSSSKEEEQSVLDGSGAMTEETISEKPLSCSTPNGQSVTSHHGDGPYPVSKSDDFTQELQSSTDLKWHWGKKYENVPHKTFKLQSGCKRGGGSDIESVQRPKLRKGNSSESDSIGCSDDEAISQVKTPPRRQSKMVTTGAEAGERSLVDYLKQLDDSSSGSESMSGLCGSLCGSLPRVCGSSCGSITGCVLSGTDDSGLGLRAEADGVGLVDYSSSSEDESCDEFKHEPVLWKEKQNLHPLSCFGDSKLRSVNHCDNLFPNAKDQNFKDLVDASEKSVHTRQPGKDDERHLSVDNLDMMNVNESVFDHLCEVPCKEAEMSDDDDVSSGDTPSGDLSLKGIEEKSVNNTYELHVSCVPKLSIKQSEEESENSADEYTVDNVEQTLHNILRVSGKGGDKLTGTVSPDQNKRATRQKGVSRASEEPRLRGLRQQPRKTQLFQAGLNQSLIEELEKERQNQSPQRRDVLTDTRCHRDVSANARCQRDVSRDVSATNRSQRDVTIQRQGKKESDGLSESNGHSDSGTMNMSTDSERKGTEDVKSPGKDETEGRSSSNKRKSDGKARSKQPEAVVLETEEDLDRVVEVEPNLGRVVWARLCGGRWWPGLVVKGTMIYLQSERNNSSWIYWFGDHKVSQIAQDKIIRFAKNFTSKIGNFKSKLYRTAVMEALQECNRRSGEQLDHDELLLWAESGFKSKLSGSTVSLEPDEDKPVPDSVRKHLREIGEEIRRKSAYVDYDKDDEDTERENAVAAVRRGEKQLKDVCIACADTDQKVAVEHPLFKGGLCGPCQTEVAETMYAEGDDGLHSFCAVCGAGGDLFVCDAPECKRVYCRPCVEELGGDRVLKQVIEASNWQCFMCSPYTDQSDCLLHPRSDWQQRVILFFDTGYRVQVPTLDYFAMKRPLRVLSLFDGIASGKLALDQLALNLDVYYASEIDPDALVVTRCNHGNTIVQLGDVTKLEDKHLREMAPIDLLIGGSPCNDLSLANPGRKGFQFGSTALLAFDFVRVRNKLQTLNSDTHLFWLYENVASMKTEFKNTLSRFLECQPALWDAKYMSAQRRGRYFWGNIPGLYSTPAISTHMHEDVSLMSVLHTGCDRRATVDKMRCVTTRTNSLKHGKHDELFPVEMGGEATGIWISEVERLFGFPTHYTDVGNLPVTRRQKLLGRSWNIPIVKQILSPLTRYFATDCHPSIGQSTVGNNQVSSENNLSNQQNDQSSSEQTTTSPGGNKQSNPVYDQSTSTVKSHQSTSEQLPRSTSSSKDHSQLIPYTEGKIQSISSCPLSSEVPLSTSEE